MSIWSTNDESGEVGKADVVFYEGLLIILLFVTEMSCAEIYFWKCWQNIKTKDFREQKGLEYI